MNIPITVVNAMLISTITVDNRVLSHHSKLDTNVQTPKYLLLRSIG